MKPVKKDLEVEVEDRELADLVFDIYDQHKRIEN